MVGFFISFPILDHLMAKKKKKLIRTYCEYQRYYHHLRNYKVSETHSQEQDTEVKQILHDKAD